VPSDAEVREELQRIVASARFVTAGRLPQFLRHVVEVALAGDVERLKESVLGIEFFKRGNDFDPRLDPIVRVEARRLRARLEEYYSGEGASHSVHIEIPRGAYVPVFRQADPDSDPASQAVAAESEDESGEVDQPNGTAAVGAPSSPASTGQVVTVKRSPIWLYVAAASLFAVAAIWFWSRKPWADSGQSRTVAVLPFANLTGDAANDYLGDGMTEELIDALSRLRGLQVTSRGVAFQYKGKSMDPRELGRQLNVHDVLEGSVRQAGARIRVTARLVDTSGGFQIWSGSFDRQSKDIFDLQREIAESIAGALRVPLGVGGQSVLSPRYTSNIQVYDLYLKARALANVYSEGALLHAVDLLNEAVRLDAGYAPAHASLANLYTLLAYYRVTPAEETWGRALTEARQAIQIDANLAEAHSALGFVEGWHQREWVDADREFQRALALNPDSADAHLFRAVGCLLPQARFDEALAEFERARELDPGNIVTTYTYAFALTAAGRNRQAVDQYKRALELKSDFADMWWDYGMALAYNGQSRESMAAFGRSAQLRHRANWQPGACELALNGRAAEALASARREIAAGIADRERAIDFARCAAVTGLKDDAFRYFEKALTENEPQVVWLKADPRFRALRGDRRYDLLLKRLNLN
jgi:TolB-like protein/tetratricopeptide (TPR) repeat protein